MNYLILLDKKFPFDKGEPFLENEVSFYCEKFDKVILIPIDIGKDSKQTRKLPENIALFKTCSVNRKLYQIGIGINAIFSINYKEIKKTIKLNKYKLTIKNIWFTNFYKQLCLDKVNVINKILNEYKFSPSDRVFIYSFWLYTPATIGVYLKKYFEIRNISIKLVSRAHGFDVYSECQPYKYETIKNLDYIFPCSNDGTRYLRRKYNIDNISTSYLGTNDHGVQEIIKDNNEFLILSCSRVDENKRIHRIAETLHLIDCNNLKKIKWVHIGDGSKMKELRFYCDHNFRNINIEFLGSIKNTEVYEYYKNHYIDLFINVSYSEGLPVSIMEAISFGIPVVATNVGGNSEIVYDGYNGILIKKNFNNIDLSKAINYFLQMSVEKYNEYRKHSRLLWEKKFNAGKNYSEFLEQLCGE